MRKYPSRKKIIDRYWVQYFFHKNPLKILDAIFEYFHVRDVLD